MKSTVFTFILSFVFFFGYSQITEYRKDSSISKIYTINKGVLDGKYTSFYLNGKKSAEGNFDKNERVGEWCVWDTSGQLRMKRNYENQYKFSIAEMYDENGKSTLDKEYVFAKTGSESYNQVPDSAHLWSKEIWRKIPLNIGNVVLLESFKKAVKDSITTYDSDKLDAEYLGKISEAPVLGYKIKERVIYDKNKQFLEFQIITIAPYIEGGELFWLDFNDFKSYLQSKEITEDKEHIKTLYDAMYYHQFENEIYKESNVYGRELGDYLQPSETEQESNKIAASLIDMEHGCWLIEAGFKQKRW